MLQRSCIGGWRVFLSVADIICFVDNILAYTYVWSYIASQLVASFPTHQWIVCTGMCSATTKQLWNLLWWLWWALWWVRCAFDTHWRVVILWIQIWNCPGLSLVEFSHLSHTALSHIVSVCMWWTCMGGILSNIYTNLKNTFSCGDHDGNHDY